MTETGTKTATETGTAAEPDTSTTDHGSLTLRQVVLDCPHPRALAEFYRQLLGLHYRPGDEPPGEGKSDQGKNESGEGESKSDEGEPDQRGKDWLVLHGAGTGIAFQASSGLPPATWPDGPVPQQFHLDLQVSSIEDLHAQQARALRLGARLLRDRSADDEEPLFVDADPAGHPFCIFVA